METYLRHREEQQLKEERAQLRAMLDDRAKGVRIEDRPAMEKRETDLGRIVDAKVAPDLTPEQRDVAAREEKELREKWLEGMPSQEEMRKCPPGAIGKHMRWEAANKERILRWKNRVLELNKGNDDPDIANIELYRPTTSSLNMDNAQIPGRNYDIPSEQFKANYDQVFGKKEPDPELEALRKEVAELREQFRTASAEPQNGKPFTSEPCICGKTTCGKTAGIARRNLLTHQRHCAQHKQAEQAA